jgi:AraC-like DNA-binding protein
MAVDEMAFSLLEAVLSAAYKQRGLRATTGPNQTERAHIELAESTRLLLSERFERPLTLDGIARSVHSSPYHLSRVFRRRVGHPIHKYLNRLRLRASLERLADGERDLSGLALDLGYSSHSHFSDAFRRECGMPPSQFRSSVTTASLRQMSKNLEV